jgi:microcystin-dependent protein
MTMQHNRTIRTARALAAALAALAASQPAFPQASLYYTGTLFPVAFNFCPVNSLPADGRELSIADNLELFLILGSEFGGSGTTFKLPDLRGRVPIGHTGTASKEALGGLEPRIFADTGGAAERRLTLAHLPAHTHTLPAYAKAATHAAPGSGRGLAQTQNAGVYAASGSPAVTLGISGAAGQVAPDPVSVISPYLAINWCIAVGGIYSFPETNNP